MRIIRKDVRYPLIEFRALAIQNLPGSLPLIVLCTLLSSCLYYQCRGVKMGLKTYNPTLKFH